jgi:hypothetical protein
MSASGGTNSARSGGLPAPPVTMPPAWLRSKTDRRGRIAINQELDGGGARRDRRNHAADDALGANDRHVRADAIVRCRGRWSRSARSATDSRQ